MVELEAARSFLRTDAAIELPKLVSNNQRSRTLPVSGVAISVRPELLVRAESGNVVGALKLFFSKTGAMAEERGAVCRGTSASVHRDGAGPGGERGLQQLLRC